MVLSQIDEKNKRTTGKIKLLPIQTNLQFSNSFIGILNEYKQKKKVQ